MKTITICGSMKFKEEMLKIAFDLESKLGYCVLQCVYDNNNTKLTPYEIKNLTESHFKKIDMSDAIYIVNIDNYIGNATKNEIEYAKNKSKEIIYHCK